MTEDMATVTLRPPSGLGWATTVASCAAAIEATMAQPEPEAVSAGDVVTHGVVAEVADDAAHQHRVAGRLGGLE
jgi:hypothetical protein